MLFGGLFQSLRAPAARVSGVVRQVRWKHHYEPKKAPRDRKQKGRVPVRTGGSIKGSTLAFGTYGLRLKSEGVRLKAIQLDEADNAIMRALRPLGGKLFRRLHANISVCIKGNEVRMGKGKGGFDHWMCRVTTGKVIFEIDGTNVPLPVAKEALRIAKDKLPGTYEFITRENLPKAGFESVPRPEDRPVENFVEKLAKEPTPKFKNWQQAKNPEIRQFLRR